MVVRLRFARHGTRNNPIFHIVAINQRQARDAKPIEKLGIFDPKSSLTEPKRIEWSVDRIRYWLGVGAQPSKSVVRLLDMANLTPPGAKYKRHANPAPLGAPPPPESDTTSV